MKKALAVGAIVCTSALAMILYVAVTPPVLEAERVRDLPVIGRLPGDLGAYALRFGASSVLLGLVPLTVTVLSAGALGHAAGGAAPKSEFRNRLALLGLRLPTPAVRLWPGIAAGAFIVLSGVVGGFTPSIADYYPYSSWIVARVRGVGGAWWFVLHASLYAVLYYVPWELLFRGILIFPLLSVIEPGASGSGALTPAAAVVVFFQVIPSSLLHIGHPVAESAGAIAAGVILGVLAFKTRSILPGACCHAAAGIAVDLIAILTSSGGAR